MKATMKAALLLLVAIALFVPGIAAAQQEEMTKDQWQA